MSWFLLVAITSTLAAGEAAAPHGAPDVRSATAPRAIDLLTSPSRRVRAGTASITGALVQGVRRSGTFAALISAVQDTDVIVYVESTFGLPHGISGRILIAGTAGTTRYLRVQVHATLQGHQLIAVIAHELQHVLEVAAESSVTDPETLAAFYKRIGDAFSGGGRYDTEAARQAQRAVRDELLG